MRLPGRHSLFWKLAVLLVGFCLLVITLSLAWGRLIGEQTSHLSESARDVLRGYAAQAHAAWREEGADGLERYLLQLREQEQVWAVAVDDELHSLGNTELAPRERERLGFVRQLDWSMGRETPSPRVLSIPFADQSGRLVMELPPRFSPWGPRPLLFFVFQKLVPGLLALLLCVGLYWLFIVPLRGLREQANALSRDDLSARVGEPITLRKDELGELGRAFDHMADRLQGTVRYQRRLLSDLSHELRTPLSRLQVAYEREGDVAALRQRLQREVEIMQRLVANTLELAWMDAERPHLPAETVALVRLWDMLADDACFETAWPAAQLQCSLDERCLLRVNLNSLAQALENLLRNAIRHSPADGVLRLDGQREGDMWHLRLQDQGPGVPEAHLERIFEPFVRLDSARPGDGGFGLGMSIARNAIALQGGKVWAERLEPGLCIHICLPAADAPADVGPPVENGVARAPLL
ncbi:histidine kinase sensor domain-containing protein [Pseudomonas sp. UL073]|uniref:histidine kinase n=1 Tax=Zestomonas insulae TaxID=2809017 RepID=A0ABS2ICY6_9GAMM|nr:histidine kinase sensor domain-containing protein [Pseudomonas insulae]MBM7059782.1 histidine kinase sensor domain-containing protein [Pseudomonas insulae]